MSAFVQHVLCLLLLGIVFPLFHFSSVWITDLQISSRNVHGALLGILLAEASSSAGHVVVQYDLGETRVLNCPYWARTMEGDCHPAAYRRALFFASGLPNFLLSFFTVIGGLMYVAWGGCGRRRRSTRWKKKIQKNTHPSPSRQKENENTVHATIHQKACRIVENTKEGEVSHCHNRDLQGDCFQPVSSATALSSLPTLTTESGVPVTKVNQPMKKKSSNGRQKDSLLLGGRTYPLGPCPPPLPSSTSFGAVCEIYCLPWFLSLVVFLCTLVAFCVAMGDLSTLNAQMEFLSNQVSQAEDVLVQLGDQLDNALRHVQVDTVSDANGTRTPVLVSLLSSSSSPDMQEEERISYRPLDQVEEPSASSPAFMSPQEKWSTELFPHLRDQLSRLRSHSVDDVIRTVQSPYFLSAWTYGLFSVLLLLSSALFLTFMRWWNQLAVFRVLCALFVVFSSLTWMWVGYHSMALQFLKDSCAEVQYFSKQQTNVLSVVTTCETPRSVYSLTSSFVSSSPAFFSSPWTESGKQSSMDVPSTPAAVTQDSSTSPSAFLTASTSMSMSSSLANETPSGALYFQDLYRTYLSLVIPFACSDTTSESSNVTRRTGSRIDVWKETQCEGQETSASEKIRESTLDVASQLSSCRTALQQRWANAVANATVSLSEEQKSVAAILHRRLLALDDLLSNLTMASAITSCEGILAVAVPPLASGCHRAVVAYQSLMYQGGGLIGLMGTLGACTAAIGAKRLLLLRRAHKE